MDRWMAGCELRVESGRPPLIAHKWDSIDDAVNVELVIIMKYKGGMKLAPS